MVVVDSSIPMDSKNERIPIYSRIRIMESIKNATILSPTLAAS